MNVLQATKLSFKIVSYNEQKKKKRKKEKKKKNKKRRRRNLPKLSTECRAQSSRFIFIGGVNILGPLVGSEGFWLLSMLKNQSMRHFYCRGFKKPLQFDTCDIPQKKVLTPLEKCDRPHWGTNKLPMTTC